MDSPRNNDDVDNGLAQAQTTVAGGGPQSLPRPVPDLAQQLGEGQTTLGFLGSAPPLARLPARANFDAWERVLDQLQPLLVAGRLRPAVRRLAQFDHSALEEEREWARAFVVLSFLSQAYVWGHMEAPEMILPANVAIPWCAVSVHLGYKPVITYAAIELLNYRELFPGEPLDLSNIAVLQTFSGSTDEAWFYMISQAIEAEGGRRALPCALDALHAVAAGDIKRLRTQLDTALESILEITKLFEKMYEKTDPHIFYTRIRPYMMGWLNSDLLPDGVLYEGVEPVGGVPNGPPSAPPLPKGTFGKYGGASAAQSPIIHALDVVFGVVHHPQVGHKIASAPPDSALGPPAAESSSLFGLLRSALSAPFAAAGLVPKESSDQPAPSATPSSPTGLATVPAERAESQSAESQPVPTNAPNMMLDMRTYMSTSIQGFLIALAKTYSLRSFVLGLAHGGSSTAATSSATSTTKPDCLHSYALGVSAAKAASDEDGDTQACVEAYNACVAALLDFRKAHTKLVSLYIITQALKGAKRAGVEKESDSGPARGSGGTELISFLKQTRAETAAAVIPRG